MQSRFSVLKSACFLSAVRAVAKVLIVGAAAIGVLFADVAAAQTVDPGYAVGMWRHFRDAAVTHTFDDNDDNQLAVAVPLFDEYAFPITLFVITNVNWSPVDWDGLADASAAGHEIASHTVTHPRLNELSEAQQIAELANSQETIRDRVPGAPVLTLAYPFCVPGEHAIEGDYYIAARGCQGSVEGSTPADMMNISSMIVGSEGSLSTAAALNRRTESAAASGGWAVFLTHGIDDDGGWSPILSEELRSHVEFLDTNRERLWVDTFGNVVRYIRERNSATVVEVSADEVEVVVGVTDTLDDAVYDHPITIRRVLPAGWTTVSATQNGEVIPARVIDVDGQPFVLFDAVPDRGNVVLSAAGGTEIGANEVPAQMQIVEHYPNPSRSHATIVYDVARPGRVRLEVVDLLGRALTTLVNEHKQPGRYSHRWDTSAIGVGPYVVRLAGESGARSDILLVAR